ncbi:MAG: MnmC family methyltransferase [Methylacidiphilales bacterium]|nr:MnmC family methyltransferase [Candidatus Methylacidiphilales bacterium]
MEAFNLPEEQRLWEAEFQLKQLASGEWTLQPVAEGEVFHPVIGARQEAEQLYLRPFDFSARCRSAVNEPLVVWDVGLGAAGNAFHAVECWCREPERDLHLHSFDLNDHALRFALHARWQHPEAFEWLAPTQPALEGLDWPGILRNQGLVRQIRGRSLKWQWHLCDFPSWIGQGKARQHPLPELVFYDAYSPAKCPAMWALEHWRNLRALFDKEQPCEIAFHSRSTALRVTLLLAGFYVGRGVSIGEKDETTVAATRLDLLKRPLAKDWLGRVRRSSSARPFRTGVAGQSSITVVDFEMLAAHPQFGG